MGGRLTSRPACNEHERAQTMTSICPRAARRKGRGIEECRSNGAPTRIDLPYKGALSTLQPICDDFNAACGGPFNGSNRFAMTLTQHAGGWCRTRPRHLAARPCFTVSDVQTVAKR